MGSHPLGPLALSALSAHPGELLSGQCLRMWHRGGGHEVDEIQCGSSPCCTGEVQQQLTDRHAQPSPLPFCSHSSEKPGGKGTGWAKSRCRDADLFLFVCFFVKFVVIKSQHKLQLLIISAVIRESCS